jgi:CBS domain-containing protein
MAQRVRDQMASELSTVREDESLRSAVECVLVQRIRHLPVVDARGDLVGIFTDRDLKRALPSPLEGVSPEDYERLLDETPIGRVMTREPITLGPDASLAEAVQLMLEKKIGCIPVLEDGRLVGILTESDALRTLLGLLD